MHTGRCPRIIFDIEFQLKEASEMEEYVAPEMEIVEFETEDVITTSPTCVGGNGVIETPFVPAN